MQAKMKQADNTEELSLGGEVVAYAIIERPFAALTTGDRMNFVMDVKVSSNYVFHPKLWDAFSNSLDLGLDVSRIDELIEGKKKGPSTYPTRTLVTRGAGMHQYNPLIRLQPAGTTMYQFI